MPCVALRASGRRQLDDDAAAPARDTSVSPPLDLAQPFPPPAPVAHPKKRRRGRPRDPVWRFYEPVGAGIGLGTRCSRHRCLSCGWVSTAGATQLKVHLRHCFRFKARSAMSAEAAAAAATVGVIVSVVTSSSSATRSVSQAPTTKLAETTTSHATPTTLVPPAATRGDVVGACQPVVGDAGGGAGAGFNSVAARSVDNGDFLPARPSAASIGAGSGNAGVHGAPPSGPGPGVRADLAPAASQPPAVTAQPSAAAHVAVPGSAGSLPVPARSMAPGAAAEGMVQSLAASQLPPHAPAGVNPALSAASVANPARIKQERAVPGGTMPQR